MALQPWGHPSTSQELVAVSSDTWDNVICFPSLECARLPRAELQADAVSYLVQVAVT